ncbi:hypothetical protein [Amazonocrinis nigriterrae]|uniref:hypothetical protein n=1 Tax=Amazonocrinis nigriterrae TaxID=2840443 RepID=UPI00298EF35D|nr:hypothetical protein [Amazonocrinis nigriterrae]
MSYSSRDFTYLCQGEDVNICYQEEFLHYRFLKQPELKPKQLNTPSIFSIANRNFQKILGKITVYM